MSPDSPSSDHRVERSALSAFRQRGAVVVDGQLASAGEALPVLVQHPPPDRLAALIGRDLAGASAGLVAHALDWRPSEQQAERKQRHLELLSSLGFTVTEIDLLADGPSASTFASLDFLWVAGGSTFCLSYAIERSGAAPVIRAALANGLVYGGESAGALITGQTIDFLADSDDPDLAPERIDQGLGLVDFAVLPHWGADGHGGSGSSVADLARLTELEARNVRAYPLCDGQDLIVDDGLINIR